jgi:hypothetical protein
VLVQVKYKNKSQEIVTAVALIDILRNQITEQKSNRNVSGPMLNINRL